MQAMLMHSLLCAPVCLDKLVYVHRRAPVICHCMCNYLGTEEEVSLQLPSCML